MKKFILCLLFAFSFKSFSQTPDSLNLSGPAVFLKSEIKENSKIFRVYLSNMGEELVHVILSCPYFEEVKIPNNLLDGKSIYFFIIRRRDRKIINEGYLTLHLYQKYFIE